jgi:hypothetical protein
MATYSASKVATTVQSRAGIDITSVTSSYTIAVALVTSDVIQMCKIPAGATVQEVIFSGSASVGATASLSVGDGADTDRFITATSYAAAALTRTNAHTGHGYLYTTEDTIDVAAVSIVTGTTATVVTITVIYTMQS